MGLGFLVCKMGPKCPPSKCAVRSDKVVDIKGAEYLLFSPLRSLLTIYPSPTRTQWDQLLPTTLVSAKPPVLGVCLITLVRPLCSASAWFLTRLFLQQLCSAICSEPRAAPAHSFRPQWLVKGKRA